MRIASLLESGQGRGALRLRTVAVDHGGGKAFAIQILGQALGAALGAGEDQAAAGLFRQQAMKHLLLASAATSNACTRTFSDGFKVEPKASRTGFLM